MSSTSSSEDEDLVILKYKLAGGSDEDTGAVFMLEVPLPASNRLSYKDILAALGEDNVPVERVSTIRYFRKKHGAFQNVKPEKPIRIPKDRTFELRVELKQIPKAFEEVATPSMASGSASAATETTHSKSESSPLPPPASNQNEAPSSTSTTTTSIVSSAIVVSAATTPPVTAQTEGSSNTHPEGMSEPSPSHRNPTSDSHRNSHHAGSPTPASDIDYSNALGGNSRGDVESLLLQLKSTLQRVEYLEEAIQNRPAFTTEASETLSDVDFTSTAGLGANDGDTDTDSKRMGRFDSNNKQRRWWQTERLDLVFLTASPLMRYSKQTKEYVTFDNDLDYESEFRRLLAMLERSNTRLTVRADIASWRTLSEICVHRPKILHVSCHGAFTESGEFFLAFEGENGVLDRFTVSRLKDRLSRVDLQNFDLVFVNACHSLDAGKVFSEAGIKYVVTAHSYAKIQDTACTNFTTYFYYALIQGLPVETAFDHAKASVLSSEQERHSVQSCCCSHSHKPDCKWKKMLLRKGTRFAHNLHVAGCDCPDSHDSVHLPPSKCSWLQQLLSKNCLFSSNPSVYDGCSVILSNLAAGIKEEGVVSYVESLLASFESRAFKDSIMESRSPPSGGGGAESMAGPTSSTLSPLDIGSSSTVNANSSAATGSSPTSSSSKVVSVQFLARNKSSLKAGRVAVVRLASTRLASSVIDASEVILSSQLSDSSGDDGKYQYPYHKGRTFSRVSISRMRVCCCSPELPHNESQKFHLLTPDSVEVRRVWQRLRPEAVDEYRRLKKAALPLFPHPIPGKVDVKSSPSSHKLPVVPTPFVGRNAEMFEAVQMLGARAGVSSERLYRVLHVWGEQGIGVSTFAKAVCRYMQERKRHHFIEDIVYVDLKGHVRAEDIVWELVASLDLEITSLRELLSHLENWNGILVLNHCEEVIENDETGLSSDSIERFPMTTSDDDSLSGGSSSLNGSDTTTPTLSSSSHGKLHTRHSQHHLHHHHLHHHHRNSSGSAIGDLTLRSLIANIVTNTRHMKVMLTTVTKLDFTTSHTERVTKRMKLKPLADQYMRQLLISLAGSDIMKKLDGQGHGLIKMFKGVPQHLCNIAPLIPNIWGASIPPPCLALTAHNSVQGEEEDEVKTQDRTASNSASPSTMSKKKTMSTSPADVIQVAKGVPLADMLKNQKKQRKSANNNSASFPTSSISSSPSASNQSSQVDNNLLWSAYVSIKYIQDNHPLSFHMLCMLSLFPAGLSSQDLQIIWQVPESVEHDYDSKSGEWQQHMDVITSYNRGDADRHWLVRKEKLMMGGGNSNKWVSSSTTTATPSIPPTVNEGHKLDGFSVSSPLGSPSLSGMAGPSNRLLFSAPGAFSLSSLDEGKTSMNAQSIPVDEQLQEVCDMASCYQSQTQFLYTMEPNIRSYVLAVWVTDEHKHLFYCRGLLHFSTLSKFIYCTLKASRDTEWSGSASNKLPVSASSTPGGGSSSVAATTSSTTPSGLRAAKGSSSKISTPRNTKPAAISTLPGGNSGAGGSGSSNPGTPSLIGAMGPTSLLSEDGPPLLQPPLTKMTSNTSHTTSRASDASGSGQESEERLKRHSLCHTLFRTHKDNWQTLLEPDVLKYVKYCRHSVSPTLLSSFGSTRQRAESASLANLLPLSPVGSLALYMSSTLFLLSRVADAIRVCKAGVQRLSDMIDTSIVPSNLKAAAVAACGGSRSSSNSNTTATASGDSSPSKSDNAPSASPRKGSNGSSNGINSNSSSGAGNNTGNAPAGNNNGDAEKVVSWFGCQDMRAQIRLIRLYGEISHHHLKLSRRHRSHSNSISSSNPSSSTSSMPSQSVSLKWYSIALKMARTMQQARKVLVSRNVLGKHPECLQFVAAEKFTTEDAARYDQMCVLNSDSSLEAKILRSRASFYSKQNSYTEAIRDLRDCLFIYKGMQDDLSSAACMSESGSMYYKLAKQEDKRLNAIAQQRADEASSSDTAGPTAAVSSTPTTSSSASARAAGHRKSSFPAGTRRVNSSIDMAPGHSSTHLLDRERSSYRNFLNLSKGELREAIDCFERICASKDDDVTEDMHAIAHRGAADANLRIAKTYADLGNLRAALDASKRANRLFVELDDKLKQAESASLIETLKELSLAAQQRASSSSSTTHTLFFSSAPRNGSLNATPNTTGSVVSLNTAAATPAGVVGETDRSGVNNSVEKTREATPAQSSKTPRPPPPHPPPLLGKGVQGKGQKGNASLLSETRTTSGSFSFLSHLPSPLSSSTAPTSSSSLTSSTTTRTVSRPKHVEQFVFMRSSPIVQMDGELVVHPVIQHHCDHEWASISQAATLSGSTFQVRKTNASIQELRRCGEIGCQVLHISCDGHPDFIPLESTGLSPGCAQPLHADDIARSVASAWTKGIGLVFLNVSYSLPHELAVAHALIRCGVPYVVTSTGRGLGVADHISSSSNRFVSAFYSVLFRGKTVREAFDVAVTVVKTACGGDMVEYELLESSSIPENPAPLFTSVAPATAPTSPNSDTRTQTGTTTKQTKQMPGVHGTLQQGTTSPSTVGAVVAISSFSSVAASNASTGSFTPALSPSSSSSSSAPHQGIEDCTRRLCPSNMEGFSELARNFLGRNIEIYQGIRVLLRYSLLNLYGPEGIGKTALAVAIASFMRERHLYPDGTFILQMSPHELGSTPARMRLLEALNLKGQVNSSRDLFSLLQKKRMLIVIDNVEDESSEPQQDHDPLHHHHQSGQDRRPSIASLEVDSNSDTERADGGASDDDDEINYRNNNRKGRRSKDMKQTPSALTTSKYHNETKPTEGEREGTNPWNGNHDSLSLSIPSSRYRSGNVSFSWFLKELLAKTECGVILTSRSPLRWMADLVDDRTSVSPMSRSSSIISMEDLATPSPLSFELSVPGRFDRSHSDALSASISSAPGAVTASLQEEKSSFGGQSIPLSPHRPLSPVRFSSVSTVNESDSHTPLVTPPSIAISKPGSLRQAHRSPAPVRHKLGELSRENSLISIGRQRSTATSVDYTSMPDKLKNMCMQVGPLHPMNAASLFLHECPTQLRLVDLCGPSCGAHAKKAAKKAVKKPFVDDGLLFDIDDNETSSDLFDEDGEDELLECLSVHPSILALGGNPAAIIEAALSFGESLTRKAAPSQVSQSFASRMTSSPLGSRGSVGGRGGVPASLGEMVMAYKDSRHEMWEKRQKRRDSRRQKKFGGLDVTRSKSHKKKPKKAKKKDREKDRGLNPQRSVSRGSSRGASSQGQKMSRGSSISSHNNASPATPTVRVHVRAKKALRMSSAPLPPSSSRLQGPSSRVVSGRMVLSPHVGNDTSSSDGDDDSNSSDTESSDGYSVPNNLLFSNIDSVDSEDNGEGDVSADTVRLVDMIHGVHTAHPIPSFVGGLNSLINSLPEKDSEEQFWHNSNSEKHQKHQKWKNKHVNGPSSKHLLERLTAEKVDQEKALKRLRNTRRQNSDKVVDENIMMVEARLERIIARISTMQDALKEERRRLRRRDGPQRLEREERNERQMQKRNKYAQKNSRQRSRQRKVRSIHGSGSVIAAASPHRGSHNDNKKGHNNNKHKSRRQRNDQQRPRGQSQKNYFTGSGEEDEVDALAEIYEYDLDHSLSRHHNYKHVSFRRK